MTFRQRRLATITRFWIRGWLIGLAAMALVGCGTTSNGLGAAGQGGEIGSLHLFVMPVASIADARGKIGGFAVRVYASGRQRAQGIAIRGGILEILAYEGAVTTAEFEAQEPVRTWSFPASALAVHLAPSSLGKGYELPLPWEGGAPSGSRLTLVARQSQGAVPAVWSAPIVVRTGGTR